MNDIRKLIETMKQIEEGIERSGPSVENNMQDLQRALTDIVSFAEELYWNYETYPQLNEHQSLVEEIRMVCDQLRRKVFEIR